MMTGCQATSNADADVV